MSRRESATPLVLPFIHVGLRGGSSLGKRNLIPLTHSVLSLIRFLKLTTLWFKTLFFKLSLRCEVSVIRRSIRILLIRQVWRSLCVAIVLRHARLRSNLLCGQIACRRSVDRVKSLTLWRCIVSRRGSARLCC